jgi:hypothetical protein
MVMGCDDVLTDGRIQVLGRLMSGFTGASISLCTAFLLRLFGIRHLSVGTRRRHGGLSVSSVVLDFS